MSRLLEQPAFAPRDEFEFLREMNALTRWHWEGCAEYRRAWPDWKQSSAAWDLPFLHVGVFKHHLFRTEHAELSHQRVLFSSATTQAASRISLDARSSGLQTESTVKIFAEILGDQKRPLLVLDSAKSLQQRGEISARVAAAMSLRSLASEIQFLLSNTQQPDSVNWDTVCKICEEHDQFIVYGFTWILWTAWGGAAIPAEVRDALRGKTVHFVHSGGWKKLEHMRIDRQQFDQALLGGLTDSSAVVDFYGLVEQVGVTYPLCSAGYRHVPRWAEVLVRDPWTLNCLADSVGQLQLMNPLAYGAPYHNVLTEDLGRLVPGECACGWSGRRFELLGRVPQAEVRGCANV